MIEAADAPLGNAARLICQDRREVQQSHVANVENPRSDPAGVDEPRRRTGGRSARVLDAVARAVLEELNESGIEGFSIPPVAARAGVSNSSLYRRWTNKAALISFAGSRNSQATIPFPDCGSLRKDLAQALAEVFDCTLL